MSGARWSVSTTTPVSMSGRRCHSLHYLLKMEGLEILNVERQNFISDGVKPGGLFGMVSTDGGSGTEEKMRGAEMEESGQPLELLNQR